MSETLPDSAVALRDALRSGEVSAREAAEHFLRRIDERADLGAFVSVTGERALDEARTADGRFAAARDRDELPRLHGLPLAHKDLVDVAGSVTTFGTAALPHRVATEDDPGVAVLRAAGTVSLGKTQVPELGLNAYSENLIAPPARNPLDPERTPGGSSGGSAAAVAAGLLPVAPGSDAGGSIRIPSLACGLIGLKPGLGTVKTDLWQGRHDAFGAPRLAVSGPIARTAEDAAMLFDAMTGEASEPVLAAVRAHDSLGRLRIGLSTATPFEPAHPSPLSPEAIEAWEIAADRLEGLGHRVEEARIRYDERYPAAFRTTWTAGLGLLELEEGADRRLTPLARRYRELARARSRSAQLDAAATITAIAADMRRQWGTFDIILTPGLAHMPPRIGAFTELDPDADYQAQCAWTPYTSMVNVSGLPAIAIPTLRLESGLSAGAHLIGREGSEKQLLQLAAQLTA